MKDGLKISLHEMLTEKGAPEFDGVNTDTEGSNGNAEEKTSSEYSRVQKLLKNRILNHAGIMEKLWGDADDTNRSLFKKKLDQYVDDEGYTYHFDDDEISKLTSIVMDLSNSISKTFKRKE